MLSPCEFLSNAASMNAELLIQAGRVGCVAADAHAALLVAEGDRFRDINLLAADGKSLLLIMRAGKHIKNELR